MGEGDTNARIDLSGKVALITGASRGLGRAYARALALAGATVAISASTETGLVESQRELRCVFRRS